MVLMNLFAGQQQRHRHREQLMGTGGGLGGLGWGKEGDGGTNEQSSMEAYSTACVNNSQWKFAL